MNPSIAQLDLLHTAAERMLPSSIAPYLRLRQLWCSPGADNRTAFRSVFSQYYGLNAGGLTEAWKDCYFKLLFQFDVRESQDPYTPLLCELHEYPLQKGVKALEFSFVSKLVAMHDESQPLYDKHVRTFFHLAPPPPGLVGVRIAAFRAVLNCIRTSYNTWVADPRFQPVLSTLLQRQPNLATCHPSRLCDFLVWTVGKLDLVAASGGGQLD